MRRPVRKSRSRVILRASPTVTVMLCYDLCRACYAMISVVHAVQLITDLMVVHEGDSLIGSGRGNLSVQ